VTEIAPVEGAIAGYSHVGLPPLGRELLIWLADRSGAMTRSAMIGSSRTCARYEDQHNNYR
jgi:hypothetical protein